MVDLVVTEIQESKLRQMVKPFNSSKLVVRQIQHLQLDVELQRIPTDILNVIMLQEQVLKILEKLKIAYGRTDVQESKTKCLQLKQLINILLAFETCLVVFF